jgi:hypothetical protein
MAVQDHLGRKGGMTADLDGEMAPLWIEDMKRVVVDIEPAPAKAECRALSHNRECDG